MKNILEELARISNNEAKVLVENDIVQHEYEELEKLKNNHGLVTCTITGYKKSTSDIKYFMVTIENFKRYTGLVKVDDVVRVEVVEIGKEDESDFVGRKLICRVKEVFIDTQNVILSRDFDDAVQAMKGAVDQIDDLCTVIDEKISKYDMKKLLEIVQYPLVDARVIGYIKEVSCVAVDIYGLGIKGRIPFSLWDWSFKNEEEIAEELKGLEYIKVAVVGYTNSTNYEGKVSYFICSKITNPEEDIFYKIEKRFTQESMIVVECVKREKNYFWGRNSLFEGDIICYYDDANGNVNKVDMGGKYLVRVKKVSEKDRKFTCSFVKKMEEAPKKSITEI